MPHPVHLAAVDRARLQQAAQAVGQLDLAGAIRLLRGLLERGEDVGSENVAADDREVRRRFVTRRFLDQVADAIDAGTDLLRVDDSVRAHVLARHLLDREHRPVHLLEDVDHLAQRRRIRIDHVVGKDDGERFVADEGARDQDGVAEPQGFPLADV